MLGALSPDQERFASAVTAGVPGLDPTVVRAWIGSESGWNVTKATKNYLNVRNVGAPGFAQYETPEQAGARVAQLLRESRYYESVRRAIPQGPGAQVRAIGNSPWDAGRYGGGGRRLVNVWTQLADRPAATPVRNDDGTVTTPWGEIFGEGDAPGGVLDGGGVAGVLGLDDLLTDGMKLGLGLIFTTAALALIGFGIYRLTGTNAGDAMGAVGNVTTVGGLARAVT